MSFDRIFLPFTRAAAGLSAILNAIIRSPRIVLSLSFFVVVALSWGLTKIQYIGDVDATLPQQGQSADDFRTIRSLFRSNDTAAYIISGGTFSERVRLSCRLAASLSVDRTVSHNSVVGLGSSSTTLIQSADSVLTIDHSDDVCDGRDIDATRAAELLGPQAESVVGKEGALHIFADVHVENGAYLPFNSASKKYMEDAEQGALSARIISTGPPQFWAAIQNYSQRMGIYFPIIMVVIGLLHFEALRSVQAAVLPLVTGLLATMVTLSCMGWLGVPLDEYGSTAPVLILAVAAGHSVQLLKRYMEELRRRAIGGGVTRDINNEALVATIASMAPVLAVAVGAAAACLFALSLMDIPAIRRFGLIAGTGLIFALVIELALIPAFRAAFPPKRVPERFGELGRRWIALLDTLNWIAQRGRLLHWALAVAVLALAFGFGISKIRTAASVVEPFAATVPERIALKALTDSGVGSFPLDVVIDMGEPDSPFTEDVIRQANAIEAVLKRSPNVSSVISPVTIIRYLKCRYATISDCSTVTVEKSDEAMQLWFIFSGAGDSYSLLDDDRRYMRVRALLFDGDASAVDPLVAQLRALPGGERLLIGGPAILGKAIGDGIIEAAEHKVMVIVLISALVGLIVFRSWIAALLFLIPSVISACASYAFIGATNTTLNIATASIAALAVGVGVDYLVYFTFRLRENLADGEAWETALQNTYLSAGGASLCVATAVAGGYLVLATSRDFLVHQWLGELIPLSVLAGLFATLIIYPALLHRIRPSFLFKGKIYARKQTA